MSADLKVIVFAVLGGGTLLGLTSPNLWIMVFAAVAIGVILNGYLLAKLAINNGMPERIPIALIGALPAGLFDAGKIFLIGFMVRWLIQ